ncbi:MAG: NTP transferase domain-containing protein [Pseudomonadota bacterium]
MSLFDTVLLAAQRPGQRNALAEKHGVTHKCLVPIAGVSLIERMLSTLTGHRGCRAIHLVIEEEGFAAVGSLLEQFKRPDLQIHHILPSPSIMESALAGCRNAAAPYVITTADNVLLSHTAIDTMLTGLAGGASALLAFSTRPAVHALHEEAQRHFYKVCGHEIANCNLYALAGPDALDAAAIFRDGGQFMNHPIRLLRAFGPENIALGRLGLIGFDTMSKRVSKRLGLTIRAAMMTDGTQAIDVDNERTYGVVEAILTGKIDLPPGAGPPQIAMLENDDQR